MIIYTVEISVDDDIAVDFGRWFRKKHIPQMIGTGCFSGFLLGRRLPAGGSSKEVVVGRFFFVTYGDYEIYIHQFSGRVRAAFPARFQGKFSINRLMEQME